MDSFEEIVVFFAGITRYLSGHLLAVYMVIAPLFLFSLDNYLGLPLCISLTYAPIAAWFLGKKVIYGIVYTVTKAIVDAKITTRNEHEHGNY